MQFGIHSAVRKKSGSSRALTLDRQHAITAQLRYETGTLQALRHFIGHIPPAGQLVRGPGVVEQPALAPQHPGQLIIKGLGIELAGDTEARWVV